MTKFRKIGILGGSGPEAAVDLSGRVFSNARKYLGADYKGDESAPFVMMISDPKIGLTFSDHNLNQIKSAIRTGTSVLKKHCAVVTVACNLLQTLAKEIIGDSSRKRKLITFDVAVDEELTSVGAKEFFLIASSQVSNLGRFSIYRDMKERYDIFLPSNLSEVDILINNVKKNGTQNKDNMMALANVIDEAGEKVIVSACTDISPMLANFANGRIIIDSTEALSKALIERAITNR